MALLLGAFFDKPKKIRFSAQESDEEIELLLRAHWITNVPWLVISVVLFILPEALVRLLPLLGIGAIINPPVKVLAVTIILWYMIVLAYGLEKLLFWYFNVYIVTNKHLIDIDFGNLLNRNITQAKLDDVQSVSSSITGIIRPLFNFGDVVIETAAKDQSLKFNNVPFPDIVADRIEDLQP